MYVSVKVVNIKSGGLLGGKPREIQIRELKNPDGLVSTTYREVTPADEAKERAIKKLIATSNSVLGAIESHYHTEESDLTKALVEVEIFYSPEWTANE